MKIAWLFTGVLFLTFANLNAAVVGYWRFENNLLDSSGNNFNATTGTGTGYSTNVPGSVIDPGGLSNTASYVEGTSPATVAGNSILSSTFSTSSFTVEAYVYLNPLADNFQQVISSVNDSTQTGIYFSVGTGMSSYVSGYNGNGVTSGQASGAGLGTQAWYHVAWVGYYSENNGTALQYFVNGTAVGGLQFFANNGATHIAMSNANPWLIGGPANNFNGLIDELRISNAALAPSEFLSAVPEPGTWMLLGLAMLLVVAPKVAKACRKVSGETIS